MAAEYRDGQDEHTTEIVGDLYQALRSLETYRHYIAEADQAGDNDLAEYFRDKAAAEHRRAELAKGLLRKQL